MPQRKRVITEWDPEKYGNAFDKKIVDLSRNGRPVPPWKFVLINKRPLGYKLKADVGDLNEMLRGTGNDARKTI